jgi:cysteinyl-tRNA synthetase
LQVEGKKMSKSLGNFFTVRDLLDQGVPGEVIRFVFLSTHYRKPMDWTAEKRREADRETSAWINIVLSDPELMNSETDQSKCDEQILKALSDDLNTSFALTNLKRIARFVDNSPEFLSLSYEKQFKERQVFVASAQALGFDLVKMANAKAAQPVVSNLDHWELRLVQERIEAKETKDFSEVDRLKAMLIDAGVEVRMSKEGVELVPGPDFDPAKLEALQ